MTGNEMERKIDAVLGALTFDEKIKMIHGAGLFRTGAVERLNIPPLKMSDGPMGVRNEFQNDAWQPLGLSDDYVTYCPSNGALAMTWNRELAKRAGTVLGEEARGRGKDVILAPGINLKRTPLCGRNFEYFSEDPYLISQLAVPMIEGIESADVGACVKHFALNSQETERLWVNVEIDERTLRELYLPAFEAAVKRAKVKSIMGAYNLFRGEHCCQSKKLLGDILRGEWGYDGMVVSDWGAVHDTKAAAESALDVEMSVTKDFDDYFMANPLLCAVRDKEVDEACIDEKVRNILRFMLRVKLVDVDLDENNCSITVNAGRSTGSYNTPEHRQAVLEAARESIVLLKNDGGLLPLSQEHTKKLLVIGENASRLHANGGGSAEIKALYEISPLMGMKKLLGGNCDVAYAQGYFVPKKQETDKNWQEDSLEQKDGAGENALGLPVTDTQKQEAARLEAEALSLAREHEQIVFVGGLNHEFDVEGQDRTTLELPYGQDALIKKLLAMNPNMVVVMQAGNPVEMGRWVNDARAVVWTGYCGMEGGTALAEVLFGKVNPSGKLVESIPQKLEMTPVSVLASHVGSAPSEQQRRETKARLWQDYTEGVFVGYRYYEKYQVPVQFCFGHGLSYTQFAYGAVDAKWEDARVDAGLVGSDSLVGSDEEVLAVTVAVTNAGAVAGKETVQLYVGERQVSAENPVKELKGFEKVFLEAGETKEVSFYLSRRDFCHYDAKQGAWRVKAGTWVVSVGSSVEDIRGRVEIEIAG